MHQYNIYNLTDDCLFVEKVDSSVQKICIPPSKHATVFAARQDVHQLCSVNGVLSGLANLRCRKTWRMVHKSLNVLIYGCKSHFRSADIVAFPKRNLSGFLADMPDTLPLSSLMLPGTHDTMAFYGWVFSQCQSADTPLDHQLRSGIRVIDIRLAVINGQLIAYHGAYPQRATFQSILKIICDFLLAPQSSQEVVIMSIKQEDFSKTAPSVFSSTVRNEIYNGHGGRSMWYLDNRIPSLGEVRGKIVMFSRFGGNGDGWDRGLEGLGIHPTAWPDSAKYGFSWVCQDTIVQTHDWYSINSFLDIPEKVELSTRNLMPADDSPTPILPISYFSAASFPLAMPVTVACGFGWPNWGVGVEGVNSRVVRWLISSFCSQPAAPLTSKDNEGLNAENAFGQMRLRGWTFMDFYEFPLDNGIVPLLVECNYRGRRVGEEGWSDFHVIGGRDSIS